MVLSDASGDCAFSQEEVQNLVKECVDGILGNNGYQHSQVNQWTSNIVEQVLTQLTKMNKPFKYIVNCVIMQKNGAGLHLASSCYWDNSTDGRLPEFVADFSKTPKVALLL